MFPFELVLRPLVEPVERHGAPAVREELAEDGEVAAGFAPLVENAQWSGEAAAEGGTSPQRRTRRITPACVSFSPISAAKGPPVPVPVSTAASHPGCTFGEGV